MLSVIVLFKPRTTANGQLAELRSDLIGDTVQLLMTLTVGLVKKLLLESARIIEIVDAEAQQSHWQMSRWQTFCQQLDSGSQ